MLPSAIPLLGKEGNSADFPFANYINSYIELMLTCILNAGAI